MSHIVISGGSGLIGQHLTDHFLSQGVSVSWLTTSGKARKGVDSIPWDPTTMKLDANHLINCDVVFHLAGASVADKRWTTSRKKTLVDSRIEGTKCLYKALEQLPQEERPQSVVCASAIGIYGYLGNHTRDENAEHGSDFLAKLTAQWENEMDKIAELGIKVCKLRIGVVLAKEGGALPQLTKPVKLFAGAALGSGKQWMPWIHISDLTRLFTTAAQEEWEGSYNAIAENNTNWEITKAIGRVIKKPIWMPNVPSFVMKVMLGEMAEMVLHGIRISPEKAVKQGFSFSYVDIETALKDLLAK